VALVPVPVDTLSPHLARGAALGRDPGRRSAHLHISSLHECLRQQVYELLGHGGEEVYNPDWELAADLGDTVHDALQRHMVFGRLAEPIRGHVLPRNILAVLGHAPSWNPDEWVDPPGLEVSIATVCDPMLLHDLENRYLSGRVDGVLRMDDGSLALVDYKTVKGKYFGKNYAYLAPKLAKWETQMSVYMHYFSHPVTGEAATTGLVLMIDRGDTEKRRLYQVEYDDALVEDELDRALWAADYYRAGQLPPPEPDRGVCKFCRYQSVCPGFKKEARSWR